MRTLAAVIRLFFTLRRAGCALGPTLQFLRTRQRYWLKPHVIHRLQLSGSGKIDRNHVRDFRVAAARKYSLAVMGILAERD